jgi:hypothetical protein
VKMGKELHGLHWITCWFERKIRKSSTWLRTKGS